MRFRSFGYCIGSGLKNIARNRIFSLASVATMALCIFMFGMFYSITANVGYMVEQLSNSLCVKVFFDYGISDDRITSIGNSIAEYPEVTSIHFTSADEAWETYKEQYFADYMELAEGYRDDNPLANSASYEVYFSDASCQDDLVQYIEGIDGVRLVNSSQVTADSLSEVQSLVRVVSVAVLAVLLFVALFLINNTISVGITVRAEEIAIMKLIGARNGLIRAPFVVEGVILGIIGAAIPLGVVYALYGNVVVFIMRKFSFIANILTLMPVSELFRSYAPIAILLGVGLGLVGSISSVSRRLKV